MGPAHVVLACLALVVGGIVLARRKGTRAHVVAGRAYSAALALACVTSLFVYDINGSPNAFHVLAVVSLLTLTGGLLLSPHRLGRGAQAHGRLMIWSFLGLAMAGLAQGANGLWPSTAPWPVLLTVGTITLAGLVLVPRTVARSRTTVDA